MKLSEFIINMSENNSGFIFYIKFPIETFIGNDIVKMIQIIAEKDGKHLNTSFPFDMIDEINNDSITDLKTLFENKYEIMISENIDGN